MGSAQTSGVAGMSPVVLSVVTPAFNEESNLPILYSRLVRHLAALELEWEWVVVDDHSTDGTFTVLKELASGDNRVKGVRLARNSGSHAALLCGLGLARGSATVVMAADLQDPPEAIERMLTTWRDGSQVVWAVRESRQGESAATLGFSRLYYWMMRRVVGVRETPSTGADFFLADRCVVDALKQFGETHVSLFALLTWMGFRQASVTYVKEARLHGHSGWSLDNKLNLVLDSVTAFTYLPIRLMSLLGAGTAVLGFAYAAVVVVNAIRGLPPQGWSSLMVVVLIVGGLQMIMMGVLGEYLWRTLDESRRRPRFLIEDQTKGPGSEGASPDRVATGNTSASPGRN